MIDRFLRQLHVGEFKANRLIDSSKRMSVVDQDKPILTDEAT